MIEPMQDVGRAIDLYIGELEALYWRLVLRGP